MKALTVHQPWAQLIALGIKTIETRSWSTKYRGPLVIHAGTQRVHSAKFIFLSRKLLINGSIDQPTEQAIRRMEISFGAIVASCKLVDVVPMLNSDSLKGNPAEDNFLRIWLAGEAVGKDLILWRGGARSVVTEQLPYGDFTPGRYAWLLEDIQPAERRCPVCWGQGLTDKNTSSSTVYVVNGEAKVATNTGMPICSSCVGYGYTDPIPAKGKPGLWEWGAV